LIRTRVRFYATFREIAGAREVELELSEGARVRELLDALFARWPALREHLEAADGGFSKRGNLFVDGRAVRFLPGGVETRIEPTHEIDCFPAVAGG
jgi:molybdopterin synthase sulfur carrier subunit